MKTAKAVKKLVAGVLAAIMCAGSAGAAYIYNPYGYVRYVEDYSNVPSGWYTYPVVTLYAEDGRSEVFPEEIAEAQLSVGWFTSPEVTLYAADGRSQVFPLSMRSAQLTVGWYDSPVMTVYALDGRSAVIGSNSLDAWLSVGWYKEYTKMYDVNGNSMDVHWSGVEYALANGWVCEPVFLNNVPQISYNDKLLKVFPDGKYFREKAQADACMTNVTVPVWLMRKDGTKYPSRTTIKVNSGLANDVLAIFTEIYNHPSKFPMKSVGGYSWRKTQSGNVSEHSYGTCIDINPNENYYVTYDGRPLSGSYW